MNLFHMFKNDSPFHKSNISDIVLDRLLSPMSFKSPGSKQLTNFRSIDLMNHTVLPNIHGEEDQIVGINAPSVTGNFDSLKSNDVASFTCPNCRTIYSSSVTRKAHFKL